VPLQVIEATHVRVICDACRTASAEQCGKRELAVTARATAVPKFRKAGWHYDPSEHARTKTLEQAERDGSGRWYCPACAKSVWPAGRRGEPGVVLPSPFG
jgi:hypothetical protein